MLAFRALIVTRRSAVFAVFTVLVLGGAAVGLCHRSHLTPRQDSQGSGRKPHLFLRTLASPPPKQSKQQLKMGDPVNKWDSIRAFIDRLSSIEERAAPMLSALQALASTRKDNHEVLRHSISLSSNLDQLSNEVSRASSVEGVTWAWSCYGSVSFNSTHDGVIASFATAWRTWSDETLSLLQQLPPGLYLIGRDEVVTILDKAVQVVHSKHRKT